MNKYFQFEPVRFSAALLVFGAAVLAVLYYAAGIEAEATVLLGTVWSSAIGLFNAFVIREQVTPVNDEGKPLNDQGSITLMDVLIVLAIIIAVWVILKFIILN